MGLEKAGKRGVYETRCATSPVRSARRAGGDYSPFMVAVGTRRMVGGLPDDRLSNILAERAQYVASSNISLARVKWLPSGALFQAEGCVTTFSKIMLSIRDNPAFIARVQFDPLSMIILYRNHIPIRNMGKIDSPDSYFL